MTDKEASEVEPRSPGNVHDRNEANMTLFARISDDVLLVISRFLYLNEKLRFRISSKHIHKQLENSLIWSKAALTVEVEENFPSWYTRHLGGPLTTFELFSLKSRLRNRWLQTVAVGPAPLPKKQFHVDVYARIKADHPVSSLSLVVEPVDHFAVLDEHRKLLVVDGDSCEADTSFRMNHVFTAHDGQRCVFERTMGPFLLDASFGLSSTVFFYGQTGSGKTHTSLGSETELDGFIPQTIAEILTWSRVSFVTLRVLEIYCEKVKVLVPDTRLTKGGTSSRTILERVIQDRATRSTAYNARSSRSHAVFCLKIVMSKDNNNADGSAAKRIESTINMVDLAGTERQREDAMALDETQRKLTLREASKINLSLTTLGRVVLGLSQRDRHIPYRDSKLTLLLRSSLGGPACSSTVSGRCAFVLTLSNRARDLKESLATLRFGERARKVRLDVQDGEDSQACSAYVMNIHAVRQEMWKVREQIRQLQTLWKSCGAGRHDSLCRCDRCLNRMARVQAAELAGGDDENEPLHIPKYVNLLTRRTQLQERLDELRLAAPAAGIEI